MFLIEFIIDIVYYKYMKTELKKKKQSKALSVEALELIDHVAEILAAEFVKTVRKDDEKEKTNESSNLR